MASVSSEGKGLWRVQFKGLDEKRRTLRLGQVSKSVAGEVARRIQSIINRAACGQGPDLQTSTWLETLTDDFHEKLAAHGLVEPRKPPEPPKSHPIGPFATEYLKKRCDMKPTSLLVLGHVVRNLKDYFGADRELATITAGEADDFQRWLATGGRSRGKSAKRAGKGKGLSPATIAKRLQWCATIFRDAMRRKIITENPFAGLKQPKGSNPERQVYVPAATIETLIEAATNKEWRLLLALARFAGLRTPSEPFSLTWDCVDWERSRLRVPSPKTEVHGKPFRIVPIFPEVRKHLDAVYEAAAPGSTYILAGLRNRGSTKMAEQGFWGNMNLRQRLLRSLTRAGIQPWPKLFHNLRAACQTDLAGRFPIHVVCEWLGNTQAVAQEHYLQVTDEHFAAAVEAPKAPSGNPTQNPTQYSTESSRTDAKSDARENEKPLVFKGFLRNPIAVEGLEPTTHGL